MVSVCSLAVAMMVEVEHYEESALSLWLVADKKVDFLVAPCQTDHRPVSIRESLVHYTHAHTHFKFKAKSTTITGTMIAIFFFFLQMNIMTND